MSNTSTTITTVLGFVGSATASVSAFLRSAKKTESQIVSVINKVEEEVNLLLSELDHLNKTVSALTLPTPVAKPVAAKSTAPVKRAAPVKKSARK
jgi:hypothetical protein